MGLAVQQRYGQYDPCHAEITMALLMSRNKPFALALYKALPTPPATQPSQQSVSTSRLPNSRPAGKLQPSGLPAGKPPTCWPALGCSLGPAGIRQPAAQQPVSQQLASQQAVTHSRPAGRRLLNSSRPAAGCRLPAAQKRVGW